MSKLFAVLSPALIVLAMPPHAMADAASATEVTVVGQRADDTDLPVRRTDTSDTARLLSDVPGLSLQAAGGVSARPILHGLDDDRVRITVDGMDLTSACANHMNPALSFAAPFTVNAIGVQAGITPVSSGGDSLGGTIAVKSAPPMFAETAGAIVTEGHVGLFYRSNGDNRGGAASAAVASDTFSFRVDVGAENASDYKDGKGKVVTSTYYKTRDLSGMLAYRQNGQLLTFRAGTRSVPGQGFANQQMDMIKNTSTFANLTYEGDFGWGRLEAQTYAQTVHHLMNIGPDKLTLAGTMMMPDMPMNTRGQDYGTKLNATINTSVGKLKVGSEYHHFGLDDWWPPVAGTMMMAPETFININDGRRDRTSLFAELVHKAGSQWTSLLGVRADHVVTDTQDVSGYNMMYGAAAMAFNAVDHKRSETNWDATALARYTPDDHASYEFALTRKSRAPNLY